MDSEQLQDDIQQACEFLDSCANNLCDDVPDIMHSFVQVISLLELFSRCVSDDADHIAKGPA